MFVSLLISWVALAIAFAFTAWVLGGVEITGGFWSYVWISALFGIINGVIGTILRILTLPLTILTLGLFALFVNALMLELTDALTDRLTIDEFWWTTIWATLILSIASVVLDLILRSTIARAAD